MESLKKVQSRQIQGSRVVAGSEAGFSSPLGCKCVHASRWAVGPCCTCVLAYRDFSIEMKKKGKLRWRMFSFSRPQQGNSITYNLCDPTHAQAFCPSPQTPSRRPVARSVGRGVIGNHCSASV